MDGSKLTLRSFVSESTLDEARKNREANGVPDQPYDPRTLYERLEEQRRLKEDAFAEATKLGNLIHRIDDDESEFLHELIQVERRKKEEVENEEKEALKGFKKEVKQRAQAESSVVLEVKEVNPPAPSTPVAPDNLATPRSDRVPLKRAARGPNLASLIQPKAAASSGSDGGPAKKPKVAQVAGQLNPQQSAKLPPTTASGTPQPKALGLGNLVDYDSNSDSE